MLALFSGEELKEVIRGKVRVKKYWGFIRKNVVKYDPPFTKDHYLIFSLWALVLEMLAQCASPIQE